MMNIFIYCIKIIIVNILLMQFTYGENYKYFPYCDTIGANHILDSSASLRKKVVCYGVPFDPSRKTHDAYSKVTCSNGLMRKIEYINNKNKIGFIRYLNDDQMLVKELDLEHNYTATYFLDDGYKQVYFEQDRNMWHEDSFFIDNLIATSVAFDHNDSILEIKNYDIETKEGQTLQDDSKVKIKTSIVKINKNEDTVIIKNYNMKIGKQYTIKNKKIESKTISIESKDKELEKLYIRGTSRYDKRDASKHPYDYEMYINYKSATGTKDNNQTNLNMELNETDRFKPMESERYKKMIDEYIKHALKMSNVCI